MVEQYYNSQPVYRMALMFTARLRGHLSQNIQFRGFWHLLHEMLGIISLFDKRSAYYTPCGRLHFCKVTWIQKHFHLFLK